ncbi:hypothetical protein COU54_01900 [Candidatus Pacearchaeota archaeon CG10_big_fil_rev_8_21_14_0_10_31_24]|nr:MAG: hypothetical protein COU54_01900 [Candidatus Pacearchaeota archaeon CG10_big_fil_rev_8_21_14_0_10_31_24]
MRKKGSGHVEIVLAMVLFVSVIMFIISVFDFQKNPLSSESVLPYVISTLENHNFADVRVYSIVLKEDQINSVIPQPNIIAIKFPEAINENIGLRVENYSGENIDYLRDSSDNSIIYVDFKENYFLFAVLSEDINLNDVGVFNTPLNENLYKISSTQDYNILSENKLERMKLDYELNYDLLRKELQISNKINFAFSIKFGEEDFINTDSSISDRKEVSSRFSRAQILRKDGKREFGDLTIKTW